MKKYSLELTVFLSGAIVMMLELTGSRILAPFVGTSSEEMKGMLATEINLTNLGMENGIVLKDDFAPVEHFAEKMLGSYFQR